jgi:tRNA (cytosine38-C5)-methyltransferase
LQQNISKLTASDLAAYRASLWLLSPSCQPYTTLNPDKKESNDPRAASFLHLMTTVLPELASNSEHPRYIFVENVAGFKARFHRTNLVANRFANVS